MGYHSNESRFLGPLFLATRDSSPFCGMHRLILLKDSGVKYTDKNIFYFSIGYQLKASVLLSKEMTSLRGYMQLSLLTEQEATHFQLYSE